MNATAHDLKIRLDAILQRIQLGREAVATGKDVDLSALSDEVQDVSEALRKTPPQIEREVVIQNLETIIVNLNSLQRELSARHGTMGGETALNDGRDD